MSGTTMSEAEIDELRARITLSLRTAMKNRDGVAVSALRGLLHAIDNTGAVDPSLQPAAEPSRQGATEVPRRLPTYAALRALIEGEAAERETAATLYEGLGESEQATRLRAEAAVVRRWLAPEST